jgi:dCMP deaminase
MDRQTKWDRRFLFLAKFWAEQCSRDPSTRVGAVIAQADQRIVSLGFNGFPIGVEDYPERYSDREVKYKFVCHAEINACISGQGKITKDCTLYVWPLFPCNECAKAIIQFGIKRVVYPQDSDNERWLDSTAIAQTMFTEAGVKFTEVDMH